MGQIRKQGFEIWIGARVLKREDKRPTVAMYGYIAQFPSAIGWRKKNVTAIIIKQQFGFPISTT